MTAAEQVHRRLELIEDRLQRLSEAMRSSDPAALEGATTALRQALAQGMADLRSAQSGGTLSPTLRQRILLADAEVAAQREAVARASAALERALHLLLPHQPAAYDASGTGSRPGSSGSVTA